MKTLLLIFSTFGVICACILFAALWLKSKLDEVDRTPHGSPPPDWPEGYDD